MTELILSALTAAVLVVGGFAAKALDKFAATNADNKIVKEIASAAADAVALVSLSLEDDLYQLLAKRKSSRVYTQEDMSLLQLSFLLWATQGIKSIRGKSYATIRTAPCGGARHPFETYLLVRQVEGLLPGPITTCP